MAAYLLAVLGLAVLMVVHESGHYFAARRFGMRVTKFSIGFGPTLWKHRPKGSPTTFQIAIIPFLAYVQIAGMNPYEEIDENDKGSYANASVFGRITTIFAGPLANYLFASILLFVGYMVGGRPVQDETSMKVWVIQEGPAAKAGIQNGDKILSINGDKIGDWDNLKRHVSQHPGQKIDIEIERDAKVLHLDVVPGADGEHRGMIQVHPPEQFIPVSTGQAALYALRDPPLIVYMVVQNIARLVTFKEKPQIAGPVNMVRQAAGEVKKGPGDAFKFLGMLSAYLGAFNLLPLPALDGGRLIFLAFEALSRRRADAKMEAKVHAVGLLMFLTLVAVVTYKEVLR